MDKDEKRAQFLQYLRKQKGLTQQQLADLIHYSDKNVSKWETGKSFPNNPNVIEQLSEIFEVSFEELIYGEFRNETNEKKINNTVKEEYVSSYNKYSKTIKRVLIGFLIMTIIFLIAIYYIYIKNSVHYYSGVINYGYEQNKIAVLITNKVNIFNFHKLADPEEKIKEVSFYYKDGEKEMIVFGGQNDDYYIQERNGYASNKFVKLIKLNCYLKITYKDDTEEIIPVKFESDYINDNVFPENTKKNLNDNLNQSGNHEITSEALIKKLEELGFEFVPNEYLKNISDNIVCKFYPRRNRIEISLSYGNTLEFLYSKLNDNKIYYERMEGEDNATVTKTIEEESKIDCTKEKCETIEDFAKFINYLKYE